TIITALCTCNAAIATHHGRGARLPWLAARKIALDETHRRASVTANGVTIVAGFQPLDDGVTANLRPLARLARDHAVEAVLHRRAVRYTTVTRHRVAIVANLVFREGSVTAASCGRRSIEHQAVGGVHGQPVLEQRRSGVVVGLSARRV